LKEESEPEAPTAPPVMGPTLPEYRAPGGGTYTQIKPEVRKRARVYEQRLALESNLDLRSPNPIVFERAVRLHLSQFMQADREQLKESDREQVVAAILQDALGFGPLDPLLADEHVSEIMVNGHEEVIVEREGRLMVSPIKFDDNEQLLNVIRRMAALVGRRIDESSPTVDARLADGSRINAVIPPISAHGPVLTVRKFRVFRHGMEDLLREGTLSPRVAEFLIYAVRGRLSILISGGTDSGKTTTLNVLGSLISHEERLITIEDSLELNLQHPHVISLEGRPENTEGRGEVTIRHLLRNSLRMRPDRVLVGEVRGAEALDMLQAMNTGHDGSLTTIHANSARDAFWRLETMVLSGSVDVPLVAVRGQIKSAIDLVVHQQRMTDGSRKIIQVSEVHDYDDRGPVLADIFRYRGTADGAGMFEATGVIPQKLDKMRFYRMEVPESLFIADPDVAGADQSRSRNEAPDDGANGTTPPQSSPPPAPLSAPAPPSIRTGSLRERAKQLEKREAGE
jgi:pilus assembly protein CpaF